MSFICVMGACSTATTDGRRLCPASGGRSLAFVALTEGGGEHREASRRIKHIINDGALGSITDVTLHYTRRTCAYSCIVRMQRIVLKTV